MYSPSLDFLRQTISGEINNFKVRKIKDNAGPSDVFRVSLDYSGGYPGPSSVILKRIGPHWPDDAHIQDREVRFYVDLLPHIGLNHPYLYYAGMDGEASDRIILLEDLGARYRFPPPVYIWQPDEVRCFLRAYACLHVRGRELLPAREEREWMLTYQCPGWNQDDILRQISDLVTRGIWEARPGVEQLVARALDNLSLFDDCPVTVLHHDVYPPNIGLPLDLDQEAVLIDWEMGGWGWAEIDLAYLFLQPFGSADATERQEILAEYWLHRQAVEGHIPPAEERREIQWLAEALFALSQVRVAHKVAETPYPTGSAPQAYWQAMFVVLQRKLKELSESI